MSRSDQPTTARQMFNHACGFSEAAHRLRQQRDLSQNIAIVPPLLVLEAFAIELLLKCMLAREGSAAPKHHHLDKLFLLLSADRRQSIESKWDARAKPRLTEASEKLGLPLELPAALARCGRAFEYVRYAYEDPDRMQFYLGDLPYILMEEIAELEPNWVRWI